MKNVNWRQPRWIHSVCRRLSRNPVNHNSFPHPWIERSIWVSQAVISMCWDCWPLYDLRSVLKISSCGHQSLTRRKAVSRISSFLDQSRPTGLCTNASRQGLESVLQGTRPRFLSDTGSRYAIIELELLAVVWAIHKCQAGLPYITVFTNYHPLISILNYHRLDEIENPWLLRLKTRIMAYSFTVEWVKGAPGLYEVPSQSINTKNPQSNGKIEATVRILIRGSWRGNCLDEGTSVLKYHFKETASHQHKASRGHTPQSLLRSAEEADKQALSHQEKVTTTNPCGLLLTDYLSLDRTTSGTECSL